MMRRVAFALTAIIALAACGSPTPTATPAATAVPTIAATAPPPSPTPIDVVAAFTSQIAAATAAELTLKGTLDVGSSAGTVSGTLAYTGGDNHQVMTFDVAGASQTTETIHKGGVGYTKTGTGPWLVDATPPASGKDLRTVLAGVGGLTDAGVETKDGVELHRLEASTGSSVDPAVLGLTDPRFVNPSVAMVFYAKADGTPAIIAFTITWTQGGQPVKMVVEYRFTSIGGSTTVAAPDHAWTPFASSRFHYSIAYPDEWDVSTTDKTVDRFVSPGSANVLVLSAKTGGFTLNEIAKAEAAANKKSGFALDSNVGDKVAGKAARFLTYHATLDGTKYSAFEIVVVNGSTWYAIFLLTPVTDAAGDLPTFKEMLGTFAFG